jgi:hypothetical protein
MLRAATCGLQLPQLLQGVVCYATKSASAKASQVLVPQKDWAAVKIPEQAAKDMPTTTSPGQAFVGDIRLTTRSSSSCKCCCNMCMFLLLLDALSLKMLQYVSNML